jgi:hypothetical protein
MAALATAMDILKLLDRSNCRKCGKPTCLAFAAAVSSGQKQLGDCPRLEAEVVERYGGSAAGPTPKPDEIDGAVESLTRELATIDLSAAAHRLGATFSGGRLTLKCLGRDFSIDAAGNIFANVHVHPWIMVPVLSYILGGAGVPPSGSWVPFLELKGGKERYPLFEQRCEKPCKRLADADTDLFKGIVGVFGRPVENRYGSDISAVLKPLARVPVLIRYWKPEDGLDSNLSFLFDTTATENLNIASLYILGTGLVLMFEKVALTHGVRPRGCERM